MQDATDEIKVGDKVQQVGKPGTLTVTRYKAGYDGAMCLTPQNTSRWVRLDQLRKV